MLQHIVSKTMDTV